ASDEEHAAGEADHEDGDHGKKNLFLHNLLLIMNSAQKSLLSPYTIPPPAPDFLSFLKKSLRYIKLILTNKTLYTLAQRAHRTRFARVARTSPTRTGRVMRRRPPLPRDGAR